MNYVVLALMAVPLILAFRIEIKLRPMWVAINKAPEAYAGLMHENRRAVGLSLLFMLIGVIACFSVVRVLPLGAPMGFGWFAALFETVWGYLFLAGMAASWGSLYYKRKLHMVFKGHFGE